ncbi:MAG: hypothetical protein HY820_19080 [Acidobacteria bacterium]|nr:hypothetical protein [Acidobacteriota bacterium]
MAFRSQAYIVMALALPAFAQTEFSYDVQHVSPVKKMTRRAKLGQLRISDKEIVFTEVVKKGKRKPVEWRWPLQEIQQLTVSDEQITVLTWQDSKWKLGADREYSFRGKGFEKAYLLLRARMDDRLVGALPGPARPDVWELRVKHLAGLNRGTEGVLRIAGGEISYSTAAKAASRTWRFSDVENISSSGPYELTLSTYERSKTHYNGYKAYHFELKDRLDEARFQSVWLALNPLTPLAGKLHPNE